MARWTRRILGLLATAAFLGVGAVSAQMIIPDGGDRVIEAAPAATPAPTRHHAKQAVHKHKPGLTKAERAARADALAEVRAQGYTTLRIADYDPKAALRVLIGRPVGDAAGGYRAFFFGRNGFLGTDALSPSSKLRVAKRGKTTVTLAYGVYRLGDGPGDPGGRRRVRFKLSGETVTPLDPIPLQGTRFQSRSG